jgi:hypothetical protein
MADAPDPTCPSSGWSFCENGSVVLCKEGYRVSVTPCAAGETCVGQPVGELAVCIAG